MFSHSHGDKQMSLPSVKSAALVMLTTVLAAVLALNAFGQDAATPSTSPQAAPAPQPQRFLNQDYSKPKSQFPNPIAPYFPRHVPAPNLSNTPRIDQLMKDGKIYLSINDAVALALENNLDMGIARYNLNIADTEILRSKGGANNFFGVNTGIVQNTPGGGVGGLGGTVGSGPGGTAPAPGGIGAGTNGLVSSTLGIGPLITSFDPILTGTLQSDHAKFECTSVFCGTVQNTTTGNVSYQQGLQWGTNLSVGFSNSRVTSNNPFTLVSPALSSGFKFQVSQHLLQGLGFLPNTRLIRITKNNKEITDVAFRLQTITTVDQIENMYWDLVFAYENVRVRQESLAFAQKTLSDTQKQVQIGSLAPIEVVRAQNTVATDQQNLITAQTNLDLQQLLLKNALSRNLQDPVLAGAEVIPSSTMQPPNKDEGVAPTEDLVNDALSHRPELAESRIDLQNREISEKALRNSLLPSIDVFAYYGGSGIGVDKNPTNLCVNQVSAEQQSGFCSGFNPSNPNGQQIPIAPTVSYGTTLNKLVTSAAPDKGAGVTLNIPLRNRQAQALQVRGELEYRQAQMRLQQIENQVRIEVRNAQFTLQQNFAAVDAAQAAVALARESLSAEQKKLALGASTSTLVLQNQSEMATAQSNLVSAMAAYEKSRLELDRATGLVLDHAGIMMDDAVRGQVTHMPNVPYVAPRQNPDSVMPSQQPTTPQNPQ